MPLNVRIIKYKTGYQVRVFSNLVGTGSGGRIDDPLEMEYLDINGDLHTVVLGSETGRTSPDQIYGENPFTGEYERFRTFEEAERSQRVSRNRTINNLYYDARSNEWDWFVTLTFSPDKVDRYNYDDVVSKVHNWLSYMRKICPSMKYIVVPELHKDGAYHFHGLFTDCDGLNFVDSGRVDKKNGNIIYNVGKYRYGYTTAERVLSTQSASGYVTKYITKELCAATFGRKRYWKSRNLEQAEKVDLILTSEDKKNFVYQLCDVAQWSKDVETEYVDVKYFELPVGVEIDLSDDEGCNG